MTSLLPIILVVEDESAIRDMIRLALIPAGFHVQDASDVKTAFIKIAEVMPQLILLDWMLPGASGVDFVKQLKRDTLTQQIPIIMLTARAEEENKVRALEIGADDYITKPFSPKELIARIKTVLRRGLLVSPEGEIRIGNLCLNVSTHQLTVDNQVIPLSPLEYKLLHFLMAHPQHVYTRAQLIDAVWGSSHDVDERTVDVHIRRLRHRLTPYKSDHHIKTVHGVGYQIE